MKKVLILVNHNVVIYNFRRELVERLIADGFEVYLSCPDGDRINELVDMGCKFIEANFNRRGTNPLSDLKLIGYYKKVMRSIKPDVVLSYTIKPNVYGGIAAAKLKIPQIANVTGLGTSVEDGGILQKISVTLYRYGLRKAKMVYFQNESNMKFMKEHKVVSDNFHVLPGSGVNLNQHCLEEYPEDTDELVFTTIGRIMKDKGTDELLDAAKIVKARYPKVHFRLIGFFDENYQEKVEQAVRDGIVEYIEQQRDIHPFIKESHAVIHPSHHEGMSNVLLESAAAGRPVLASKVPGCIETFEENLSGYAFEAKNADDLAKAIIKFIELPYDKKVLMGISGRKIMEQKFDRNLVVDEYINAINKILNNTEE